MSPAYQRAAVLWAALLMVAFLAGRWWGERDLRALLEIPKGGLYLSARQQAVFEKLGEQQIGYVRVPDPWQAHLIRLFPGPPAPPAPPTTIPTFGPMPKGGMP